MERTRTAYRSLLTQMDALVQSQFVGMFRGDEYPLVPIGTLLRQRTTTERITDTLREKYVTVALYGKGVRERSIERYDPKPFTAYRVSSGQFIYSRIDARNGAFGIIPQDLDGAVVSKDFPVFDIDQTKITVDYLMYSVLSEAFIQQIRLNSIGTTNRQRVIEEALLSYKIKLPSISDQNLFVAFAAETDKSKLAIRQALESLEKSRAAIMTRIFG